MNNTDSLLSFIRSHDHLCFAVEGGIRVRGIWTAKDQVTGVVRVGRTWETIPAKLSAVRDWLGY